ncbi:MAG: VOC family protein [Ignavibacteria bacterium]|nr:VOC family protein [Ignavibacteria bacterium]
MELKLQHAVVREASIAEAKDFYLKKLGLEVLEEAPNFFAAKSGSVRLSFFEGYEKTDNSVDVKTGVSLIFRDGNLDDARKEFESKGIAFSGEVIDIPDFHKFLEFEDPSGNVLSLAEYHVDPV